jgi:uncharacterized membrane protein YphA (DoxX/SURF4 family)
MASPRADVDAVGDRMEASMPTNLKSRSIASWVLSCLLALMFVVTGTSKLADVPPSPDNFARWGYSAAFMHSVGAVEVLCGVGILVPRLAPLAALVLLGVMAGAIKTGVVHHEVLHIALPLVLVGLLLGVVYLRRDRVLRRFQREARPPAG